MMRLIGCLTLFVVLLRDSDAIKKRICEQKGEYISCPFGEVLHMQYIEYGRQLLGVCNPYRVPNLVTNCFSTNVTTRTVIKMCEYKSACFLDADNNILGEDPCPNIPKYLVVEYICVVATTTGGPTTPTTTLRTTPTTTTQTTTTTTRRTTPTTTRSTPTTRFSTTPTTTRRTTPTTTRRTTTKPPAAPFQPFNAPKGSQTCHDYLVSGPNGVKDSQLSASSQLSYPPNNDGPSRGRLFTDAVKYSNGTYLHGAWSAGINNQRQYIQVQLNGVSVIRGIATQGRHVNPADLCCYQHVTKYRLMYSLDCVNYETIKDRNGNDKIFPGNADPDSVVTNMLDCPIVARCVRINPIDWKDQVSMRFDLIGCTANTADLGKCPNGWEERVGSNQCYLITDVHDMRTRDDASAQCQLQQGQLVKIDSIAERDWIRQQVSYLQRTQGQHHFWTGLENRPRLDNLYHKWTDGTLLDTNVMPWGNGQPDNSGGNEHCGELWDGDMNDNDCNQHYPYICERSKFWTPPVNTPSQAKVTPPTAPPITTTTISTQAPVTGLYCPRFELCGDESVPVSRSENESSADPSCLKMKPYVRPIPVGGNTVKLGNNIFYTGCKSTPTDCSNQAAGDYQSCSGCHYYVTCAPNGVFTRPCPARLKWDDNLKTCAMISSTCQGP